MISNDKPNLIASTYLLFKRQSPAKALSFESHFITRTVLFKEFFLFVRFSQMIVDL